MDFFLNVKKHIHSCRKLVYLVTTTIIIIYLVGFWFLKLGELPGLHGDEAWFGLQAIDYSQNGIHSLCGMTNYTGILQSSLSWLTFNLWNYGVQQLRVGGVILNIIGLLILFYTFYSIRELKGGLFFVLLMAQSIFYCVYPKIAWEVTSFNLLFISILIHAALKIWCHDGDNKRFWAGVFLLVNIVGSYNHILFSCLAIAGLTGTLLWGTVTKNSDLGKYLPILFLNVINVTLLHFLMVYCFGYIYIDNWTFFVLIAVVFTLITLESCFYQKLKFTALTRLRSKYVRKLVPVMLLAGLTLFVMIHGVSFFLVMTNYTPLIRFFSFETPPAQKIIYCANAGVLCAILLFFLVKDFLKSSLIPYLFVAYVGIFNVYTINPYDRYYLSLYVLIWFYLAYKLSRSTLLSSPVLISTLIVIIINTSIFTNIFTDLNRPLRPVEYSIGLDKKEKSGHFISVKPLVTVLRKNGISNIKYLSQQYFIQTPIEFYRNCEPWPVFSLDTLAVDYDYFHLGKGFTYQVIK